MEISEKEFSNMQENTRAILAKLTEILHFQGDFTTEIKCISRYVNMMGQIQEELLINKAQSEIKIGNLEADIKELRKQVEDLHELVLKGEIFDEIAARKLMDIEYEITDIHERTSKK